MGFVAFTFFVIFLLIASGGLLLFYREAMLQRISAVVSPRGKQAALLSTIQRAGFSSFGGMVEQLERVLPKSQAEVSVVQQRLIRAGYRKDSAVNLFYGAKVLVPLALCSLMPWRWDLDFLCRISGWAGGLPGGKRASGSACPMCSI